MDDDDRDNEYGMKDDIEMEYYDSVIRFYIFNLFGLIGGLAALVWAAWTLHRNRRSGGKDSVFIITLLFIDALELVLAVCIMFPHFAHLVYACLELRLVCFFLHQLVALEGVASVTHIRFAAVFSSLPCSISLTIITAMLGIFREYLISFTSNITIPIVVPVLIHAVMCILICSKAKPHQAPGRGITEKTVLVESLVSYIVLHGPCLLAGAMYLILNEKHQYLPWKIIEYMRIFLHNMFSTISCLWVMADGLLVAMVCRLPKVQRS